MAQHTVSSSGVTLYTDAACTQVATAQQVIDAFSAGGVRLSQTSEGVEVVMTVLSFAHKPDSGSGPVTRLLVADPIRDKVTTLNLVG